MENRQKDRIANPCAKNGRERLTRNSGPVDELGHYLTFEQGGMLFAADVFRINEIVLYTPVRATPELQGFIHGVIEHRGRVVPVIDLAARLGTPTSLISRRSCIVIADLVDGTDHHEIGMLVDAVAQVIKVPDAELKPAIALAGRMRIEYLLGVIAGPNGSIAILDMQRALGVDHVAPAPPPASKTSSRAVVPASPTVRRWLPLVAAIALSVASALFMASRAGNSAKAGGDAMPVSGIPTATLSAATNVGNGSAAAMRAAGQRPEA